MGWLRHDRDPGPRAALAAASVSLASILVAVHLGGDDGRVLVTIVLPAAALAVFFPELRPSLGGALALLAGSVALGGGAIARSALVTTAGVLYLLAGAVTAWGVNHGRTRRRAWLLRVSALAVAVLLAFLAVYPTLLAVDYTAKPRSAIREAALGLRHERVALRASDGVHLSGWYAPARNGAAIVLVHGGGGDRQGTIRHARMLAAAGYGVLLYDARGRGESAGRANAAGWEWDRDVRGAVDFLWRRGVRRIGLLGLSTGAEAVITEAASDTRVRGVVADGAQGRTSADASHLPWGERIGIQPALAVLGAELRIVRGEEQPLPLIGLVHQLAATRPLLMIGTVKFERDLDRAYVGGTRATLWELSRVAHTHGLTERPEAYRKRVLGFFRRALGPRRPAASR